MSPITPSTNIREQLSPLQELDPINETSTASGPGLSDSPASFSRFNLDRRAQFSIGAGSLSRGSSAGTSDAGSLSRGSSAGTAETPTELTPSDGNFDFSSSQLCGGHLPQLDRSVTPLDAPPQLEALLEGQVSELACSAPPGQLDTQPERLDDNNDSV